MDHVNLFSEAQINIKTMCFSQNATAFFEDVKDSIQKIESFIAYSG